MDALAANRSQLAAALARVAAGDRAALRIVYQDTSAKLFGVCLRILNDRSEAEDVLQDVYVTVWRKAGSFDPTRASPITWLVAIARNRAIDKLRSSATSRRSEPIETADDVRDDAPAALDLVVAAEQQARLKVCLGELEEGPRKVLKLVYYEGMTYEEVAVHLGAPLGTVKSWIRRSLIRLRGSMER